MTRPESRGGYRWRRFPTLAASATGRLALRARVACDLLCDGRAPEEPVARKLRRHFDITRGRLCRRERDEEFTIGGGAFGADEIPSGQIRLERIVGREIVTQSDDRRPRNEPAQGDRVLIDVLVALRPA